MPIKTKKDFARCSLKMLSFVLGVFMCSGLYSQKRDQEERSSEISGERAFEISSEIGTRQAGIEEIQTKVGIYDQSLIEAYRSLAALYNEIEDYENASAVFLDALQVARINTGLYSAEQIPLVRFLIENKIKAEEWRSADDFHELEYLISSRVFAPVDTGYLNSVRSYGAWKLRVIRENLFNQSGQSLVLTAGEVSSFYNRVIGKVEQEAGLQDRRLLSVLYAKTQVDMTLARYVASVPYTNFQGTASPFINQTRCRNIPNSRGQAVRRR